MVDLSLKYWWTMMSCKATLNRKAMTFLTMLVSWEIWKERNSSVFNNNAAPNTIVLEIIKSEAKLWVTMCAKHLTFVMKGE
jgi:hypothetical protein